MNDASYRGNAHGFHLESLHVVIFTFFHLESFNVNIVKGSQVRAKKCNDANASSFHC